MIALLMVRSVVMGMPGPTGAHSMQYACPICCHTSYAENINWRTGELGLTLIKNRLTGFKSSINPDSNKKAQV
ncbi:hypothetical protein OO013_05715 [Mangrovivirga sp. M17]|uniref:Secreted protein n=1 Tax=Mangrovivirga halotolerans TaxID=2993936 RepID=A0ABT3RP29_9BACT|nr:hypothetical protein [Mangrovivirga halotolerans]MCX2743352.1 hypothetical protein [Mangrovivirga halotolerans]